MNPEHSTNRATPKHPAPPPWTPGPRRVETTPYGANVIAKDGTAIAAHWTYPSLTEDESHANAILDAAGPELVKELQRLVDALEPLELDGEWPLDSAGIATLNGARAARGGIARTRNGGRG